MKFAAIFILSVTVIHFTAATLCPNQKDTCPSSTTCCQMVDGSYGCCPYKGAQCCKDKIHCCPPGTRCNVKRQSCDSANFALPFNWMVPVYNQQVVSKAYSEPAVDIVNKESKTTVSNCPDGNSCPEKSTCCQMPSGIYGCCPYSKGNCCKDKEHCCPSGYNCDLSENRCVIKKSSPFDAILSHAPKYFPIFNIKKNDFEVPEELSCSSMNLCSLKGQVCCQGEDSIFCCPKSTVCSKVKGFCATEMKLEVPASSFRDLNIFDVDLDETTPEDITTIVCPDKTEACPSSNTCCQLSSGRFGCCPMPQATCCADKLHCCPNGYVCSDDGCERQPLFSLLNQAVFIQRTPLAKPLF